MNQLKKLFYILIIMHSHCGYSAAKKIQLPSSYLGILNLNNSDSFYYTVHNTPPSGPQNQLIVIDSTKTPNFLQKDFVNEASKHSNGIAMQFMISATSNNCKIQWQGYTLEGIQIPKLKGSVTKPCPAGSTFLSFMANRMAYQSDQIIGTTNTNLQLSQTPITQWYLIASPAPWIPIALQLIGTQSSTNGIQLSAQPNSLYYHLQKIPQTADLQSIFTQLSYIINDIENLQHELNVLIAHPKSESPKYLVSYYTKIATSLSKISAHYNALYSNTKINFNRPITLSAIQNLIIAIMLGIVGDIYNPLERQTLYSLVNEMHTNPNDPMYTDLKNITTALNNITLQPGSYSISCTNITNAINDFNNHFSGPSEGKKQITNLQSMTSNLVSLNLLPLWQSKVLPFLGSPTDQLIWGNNTLYAYVNLLNGFKTEYAYLYTQALGYIKDAITELNSPQCNAGQVYTDISNINQDSWYLQKEVPGAYNGFVSLCTQILNMIQQQ